MNIIQKNKSLPNLNNNKLSFSSIKSLNSLKSLNKYNEFKKKKKEYLYTFFLKKDLNIILSPKYKLELIEIPAQYYLWRGVSKQFLLDKIIYKKDYIFKDSLFFADKQSALNYGSNLDNGLNLQFKIKENLKLLDISNIENIKKIWRSLDLITLQNINDNSFSRYIKTQIEINTRKKKSEQELLDETLKYIKEIFIDSCVNYTYDIDKLECRRESSEWGDVNLYNLIIKLDDKFDGWIHFKSDIFHSEILIFNPKKNMKYIDYHFV
jgi:hypothetical protein